MRTIRYTSQFQKDFKRMGKRGVDMKKLHAVIDKLVDGEELDDRYKDHSLQGRFVEARDCHLGPDWILIYAIAGGEVRLIRSGTHSDLFAK